MHVSEMGLTLEIIKCYWKPSLVNESGVDYAFGIMIM